MIQFNADGSGVFILDSDSSIRQSFSGGISRADLLSMQAAFIASHPPVLPPPRTAEVTLSQATVDAIFKGAERMTDVRQFGTDYLAGVKSLIDSLENLRVLQDRVTQDSTLFAAYLASPGARTDLQLIDLQAASSAIVQLLFAFDSGSPTQKSELFKLL